jgi:hypothetical protein
MCYLDIMSNANRAGKYLSVRTGQARQAEQQSVLDNSINQCVNHRRLPHCIEESKEALVDRPSRIPGTKRVRFHHVAKHVTQKSHVAIVERSFVDLNKQRSNISPS